jgi:phenylalanyl-tRNA synthetase beta chain
VSEKTTGILLEDAFFEPVTVRTTSRRLALPSEASFRFERIVDCEMVDWASKRTAQLIIEVAGGKAAKGVVDIYPKKPEAKEITVRLSRLKKLLGIDIAAEEVLKILTALGFAPKQKGDLVNCTVPSWRLSDVYREADLIEEVSRIYGYDKIPMEHKISIEVVPVDSRQRLVEMVGTYLNGCGFYETINVSFVDNSVAELFGKGDAGSYLAVKDVSRKTANLLRQSLLPSLLGVLKTNLNAGNTPCRIFEISDTFVPADKAETLPIEETKITLCSDGELRELRGVVEGLIKTIDKNVRIVFSPAELSWAEVGAQITVNDVPFGAAGVVSEAVKDKFDFKNTSPVAAELDFAKLSALQTGPVTVKAIPKFPAIERDLSIVIDENICWSDIMNAVKQQAPDELEDVCFVGIYRGKGIPAGQKSLTLSLRFRDTDGTLTHEAVDAFESEIVEGLTKSVGAQLRTL